MNGRAESEAERRRPAGWFLRPGQIHAMFTRLRRLVADVLLSALAFAAATILPLVQAIGMPAAYQTQALLKSLVIFTALSAVALALSRTYRMIWL